MGLVAIAVAVQLYFITDLVGAAASQGETPSFSTMTQVFFGAYYLMLLLEFLLVLFGSLLVAWPTKSILRTTLWIGGTLTTMCALVVVAFLSFVFYAIFLFE